MITAVQQPSVVTDTGKTESRRVQYMKGHRDGEVAALEKVAQKISDFITACYNTKTPTPMNQQRLVAYENILKFVNRLFNDLGDRVHGEEE